MPQPKSVQDEERRRHVEAGTKNEQAEMPKRHNKDGSMVKVFHDYGTNFNKIYRRFRKL